MTIGLVCLSAVFTLALIEVVLRNSVEFIPLNYQKYLPKDVKIIAQNTKDKLVPDSYVALLGDSYAAGWGDWYRARLDETSLGNPPYHSADIIHRVSGANVLTFARPGQGSFDGIAYFPKIYHERLLARGFPLSDPSVIIVYFYEGNDLNDNIYFLNKYWSGDDPLTQDDVATLVESISAGKLRKDGPITKYLRDIEFLHQLYVAKFLYVLGKDVTNLVTNAIDGEADAEQSSTQAIPARIAGKTIEIPGPVESPPVQLTEPEVVRAVSVFEASLRYLMATYSKSELFIVYLPSPIMSYELEAATVPIRIPGGAIEQYPVSEVERMSDLVCQQVVDVAARLNARFLDTRPPIRAAAQVEPIHGPLDWYHFNKVGYKVLGTAVGRYLVEAYGDLASNGAARPPAAPAQSEFRCADIAKYEQDKAVERLGPRLQRANWN